MKEGKVDKPLLSLSLFFVFLGLFLLATISFPLSYEKFNDGYYLLKHQIIYGLIPGLFLGFIMYKIPVRIVYKCSFFFFLFSLILVLMVFFPIFGRHFLGASRWLTIKGVSFQPSEFLKFTSIIYLASLISKHFSETYKTSKKKKNKSISLFFTFIIVLGIISIILICQPDISTLIIIGSALIFVYFSAKTPLYQTLILLLLSILGTVLLLTSAPYRFKRLLVFLNPEIDPLGLSYQLRQSLIAIGSGGVFGEGIGMSRQKFGFLPQPISDSIFSVFAEETGFIGCLFLIALYLFFFYRGVKISRNASSTFLELSGIGISFLIIIQAFLHIAGLSGILPLTGSVLPFISYGGSHLIMELMSVGFLLNISKHQRI